MDPEELEYALKHDFLSPAFTDTPLMLLVSNALFNRPSQSTSSVDHTIIPRGRFTPFHVAVLEFARQSNLHGFIDRYIVEFELFNQTPMDVPPLVLRDWKTGHSSLGQVFPPFVSSPDSYPALVGRLSNAFGYIHHSSSIGEYEVRELLSHRSFQGSGFTQLKNSIVGLDIDYQALYRDWQLADNMESSRADSSLFTLLSLANQRDMCEMFGLSYFSDIHDLESRMASLRFQLLLHRPFNAFCRILDLQSLFMLTNIEVRSLCRLSIAIVLKRVFLETTALDFEKDRLAFSNVCLEFLHFVDSSFSSTYCPCWSLSESSYLMHGMSVLLVFLYNVHKVEGFPRVISLWYNAAVEIVNSPPGRHMSSLDNPIESNTDFPLHVGALLDDISLAISSNTSYSSDELLRVVVNLHLFFNAKLSPDWILKLRNLDNLPEVILSAGDAFRIRPDYLLLWIFHHKGLFDSVELFHVSQSLGICSGTFNRGNFRSLVDKSLHFIFRLGDNHPMLNSILLLAVSTGEYQDDFLSCLAPSLPLSNSASRVGSLIAWILSQKKEFDLYTRHDGIIESFNLDRLKLELLDLGQRELYRVAIDGLRLFYPNNILIELFEMVGDFSAIADRLKHISVGARGTQAHASLEYFEQFINGNESQEYSHVENSLSFSKEVGRSLIENTRIQYRVGFNPQTTVALDLDRDFGGEAEREQFFICWSEYTCIRELSTIWLDDTQRHKFFNDCIARFSRAHTPFMIRGDFFYKVALDLMKSYPENKSWTQEIAMILYEAATQWRKCSGAYFSLAVTRLESRIHWMLYSSGIEPPFASLGHSPMRELVGTEYGFLQLPQFISEDHLHWFNNSTDLLDGQLLENAVTKLLETGRMEAIVMLASQLEDSHYILDFTRVMVILAEMQSHRPKLEQAIQVIQIRFSRAVSLHEVVVQQSRTRLGLRQMDQEFHEVPSLTDPRVKRLCHRILSSSISGIDWEVVFSAQSDSERFARLQSILRNQLDLSDLRVTLLQKCCLLFKSSLELWKTNVFSQVLDGNQNEISTLEVGHVVHDERIMRLLLDTADFLGPIQTEFVQLSSKSGNSVYVLSLVRAFIRLLMHVSRMSDSFILELETWPWNRNQFDDFVRIFPSECMNLVNQLMYHMNKLYLSADFELEYLLCCYFAAYAAHSTLHLSIIVSRINTCLFALSRSTTSVRFVSTVERVVTISGDFEAFKGPLLEAVSRNNALISQFNSMPTRSVLMKSFVDNHMPFSFWESVNDTSLLSIMLPHVLSSRFHDLCMLGNELSERVNSTGTGSYRNFIALLELLVSFYNLSLDLTASRHFVMNTQCLAIMSLITIELEWSSKRLRGRTNFFGLDQDTWIAYSCSKTDITLTELTVLLEDMLFSAVSKMFISRFLKSLFSQLSEAKSSTRRVHLRRIVDSFSLKASIAASVNVLIHSVIYPVQENPEDPRSLDTFPYDIVEKLFIDSNLGAFKAIAVPSALHLSSDGIANYDFEELISFCNSHKERGHVKLIRHVLNSYPQ